VLSESKILREVPILFARWGMMLSKYWDSDRRRDRLKLLLKIRSERDMRLLPCEACQIISAIQAVEKVPGDMAEVGVASGASAMLISASAPARTLHLFDTFEGLPEPTAADSRRFYKGQYRVGVEDVQKYLKDENVRIYKGIFPETAKDLADKRFAFVHLDGDLYQTTWSGLEWFYPRMSTGGILICHDFDTAAGVNRAFEEFFRDKPEPYIELTGCQCLFVKM
jgi:O-methyltransferase